MNKIIYKSLPDNKSPNGHTFKKGVWYKAKGNLEICKNGFHASENIIDAMSYVNCFWLAKVEVKGKSIIEKDKECWEEIRIIEWHKWTKKDSVSLAIYSAELVLENFEKQYPKDIRPREAIKATKKVLKNDTIKNRSAARSAASAAWSAARSAAWSAAESAESAAESAESAAESAAWSAESEASAAESAASAASEARSALKEKIHNWILKRKF